MKTLTFVSHSKTFPNAPQPRTEWKVKSAGVKKCGILGSSTSPPVPSTPPLPLPAAASGCGHLAGEDGGASLPVACFVGDDGIGTASRRAVKSSIVTGSRGRAALGEEEKERGEERGEGSTGSG